MIQLKRNPYLSKWNILFDTNTTQWISFEPEIGKLVYPCYACRHMFSSKTSFLDHANRRSLLLKYKCTLCCEPTTLTFFSPCALLLHCRQHFTLISGEIDLANVEICDLPYNLAGFLPHPDIPLLYDINENEVDDDVYVNTKFYTPNPQHRGRQVVNFLPIDLFFKSKCDENTSLTIRQVCFDVPRCVFIRYDDLRPPHSSNDNLQVNAGDHQVSIKEEPIEIDECDISYDMNLVDTSKSNENYPLCPECGFTQKISMTEHFLCDNKPFDESLKCSECRFIASSKCSLSAHIRIHTNEAPFVCPECGKDFDNVNNLFNHLDEVCFHLYKQVRFRCPGKKCGKLFAQTNTYSAHFIMHMECLNKCIVCSSAFFNKEDFYQHVKTHPGYNSPVLIYKCNVCGVNNETFTENDYQNHILWHISDRKQCTYVYICKRCRSYFRSKQTYAIHLLRCTKPIPSSAYNFFKKDSKEDHGVQIKKSVIFYCNICGTKVNLNSSQQQNCPKCSAQLYNHNKSIDNEIQSDENDMCILCNENIDNGHKDVHSKQCKYINPVIILKTDQTISEKSKNADLINEVNSVNIIENYNLELERDPLQLDEDPLKLDDEYTTTNKIKQEINSPKSDEIKKRKRKFPAFASKNKKKYTHDADVLVEKPISFNGTYNCNVCCYSDTIRESFHEHIIGHRDISTSYQCMECGECFVVKPSLLKHLTYFHCISDTDQYLEENDCFDKDAVKELEENMKLIPLKLAESVLENQCRVCSQHFNDLSELKKHTRTHGMAFLLQNLK